MNYIKEAITEDITLIIKTLKWIAFIYCILLMFSLLLNILNQDTTKTVIDYKTYVCTTYDDNTMECVLESRG